MDLLSRGAHEVWLQALRSGAIRTVRGLSVLIPIPTNLCWPIQHNKSNFSNNYFLFCFYYTKVTLSIHLDSHVILKEMCFNTKIAFNLFIYNVFIC